MLCLLFLFKFITFKIATFLNRFDYPKEMRLLVFFLLMSCNFFAQKSEFLYQANAYQTFRIRPGTEKIFHYIKMNKADIKRNTLFKIDEDSKKLVIPKNGYYEISAFFNFNPSTSNIKNNRGGLNFGMVQVTENQEIYIASVRKSFNKENQDIYSHINLLPTIVYLQKDMVIAPAISSGLIGNVLLGCELGCDKKDKGCTSFQFKIKLISNESGSQKYF